jgi:DNA-binding YbaB/EbfC family protein
MKGFGGGGMQQLMRQANQMQNRIKKLQEELATREFEGTSGGDAVKIKVTGANSLTAVTIDPEVVKAGDIEMLQDLVLTAVNEALATAKKTSDAEMAKITGGFPMPGQL